MITDSFDPVSDAVVSPGMLAKPYPGFPETVVMTFQPTTFRGLLDTYQPAHLIDLQVDESMGQGGPGNVYALSYKGRRLGAYLAPVGASWASAIMEMAIACGAKRFVVFGSCGALREDLASQGIIVPTQAYRDEGTSYHYVAPGDYIDLVASERVAQIMTELGVPHVRGKVWSTDGFFRETKRNMAERLRDGCVCVDMEAAALAAVAQYRGVEIYYFVYAADSLSGEWNPRELGSLPSGPRAQFVRIGLEIARRVDTP